MFAFWWLFIMQYRPGLCRDPHPLSSRVPAYAPTMKQTLSLTLGTLVLAGALVGCQAPPQEDLTTAQTALAAAAEAEADLYVTDLYVAAQDSFAAAQAEIEAQNAESQLSRNYARSKSLLQFVTETATQAQAEVETRKGTMAAETDALILQAEAAVSQAQALMAQAPTSEDDALALVTVNEEAGTAASTLEEAKAAQTGGDVARAHALAKAALDQANALVEELNGAMAETDVAPIS